MGGHTGSSSVLHEYCSHYGDGIGDWWKGKLELGVYCRCSVAITATALVIVGWAHGKLKCNAGVL